MASEALPQVLSIGKANVPLNISIGSIITRVGFDFVCMYPRQASHVFVFHFVSMYVFARVATINTTMLLHGGVRSRPCVGGAGGSPKRGESMSEIRRPAPADEPEQAAPVPAVAPKKQKSILNQKRTSWKQPCIYSKLMRNIQNLTA